MTDGRWVRRVALAEGLVLGVASAEAADVLRPAGEPDFDRTMLVLGIFCTILAVGVALYTHRSVDSWQRRAGSIILAVGGGYMAGLALWSSLGHQPAWIVAVGAAVTLGGAEVILRLARRLVDRQFPPAGGNGPP